MIMQFCYKHVDLMFPYQMLRIVGRLLFAFACIGLRGTVVAQSDVPVSSAFSSVYQELDSRRLIEEDSRNQANARGLNISLQRSVAQAMEVQKPMQEFAHGNSRRVAKVDQALYPETVAAIADPSADYRAKNERLFHLRLSGMSEAESAALLSFLFEKKLKEDGTEDLEHLSHKNDALAGLISQRPLPNELGWLMCSIAQDENESIVWREYVLQYFTDYYRAKWPLEEENSASKNPYERQALQRMLAAALFHEDTGLAGTALIVVEDLGSDYPEFSKEILSRAARRIVASPDSSLASRITAVSILGETPDGADITLVSNVALDIDSPLALRMAAVGRLKAWSNDPRAHTSLDVITARPSDDPGTNRIRSALRRAASNETIREPDNAENIQSR